MRGDSIDHPQVSIRVTPFGERSFGVLLILEPSTAAELDRITVTAHHWHTSNSNREANLSDEYFL